MRVCDSKEKKRFLIFALEMLSCYKGPFYKNFHIQRMLYLERRLTAHKIITSSDFLKTAVCLVNAFSYRVRIQD